MVALESFSIDSRSHETLSSLAQITAGREPGAGKVQRKVFGLILLFSRLVVVDGDLVEAQLMGHIPRGAKKK
jgi:hypothetical protein